MRIYLLLFGLLILSPSIAQYGPVIKTPEPASISPQIVNGASPESSSKWQPSVPSAYEQHNAAMGLSSRKREINQREIEEAYRDLKILPKESDRINNFDYRLPAKINESQSGVALYLKAFNELNAMLADAKTLSLRRAVFVVENAYNPNLSYDEWNKNINQIKLLCYSNLKNKRSPNAIDKMMAIFKYFSDTSSIVQQGKEGTLRHYPTSYDFEDFYGKDDWTKMFVSKLIKTNRGQCHSLPLLYLILAQEMGVEAYLAYGPEHTYIKVKGEGKNWYNIELTNNMLSSDAWLMESGYINSEAVKSKIYLDTVSLKRVMAEQFFDLGKGFSRKFGIDEFVLHCANKALTIDPDYLFALQLKADYQSSLANYVLAHQRIETKEQLEQDPKANAIVQNVLKTYEQIDNTGFERIPEEVYIKWLNTCKAEKQKQQHNNKIRIINNQIK